MISTSCFYFSPPKARHLRERYWYVLASPRYFCGKQIKYLFCFQVKIKNVIAHMCYISLLSRWITLGTSQMSKLLSQEQLKEKSLPKKQPQTQDDDVIKEPLQVMRQTKDDFDRFGEYVAKELRN